MNQTRRAVVATLGLLVYMAVPSIAVSAETYTQTRMTIARVESFCPVVRNPPADLAFLPLLAATVLPSLIKIGVDTFAGFSSAILNTAAKEKVTTVKAPTVSTYLYRSTNSGELTWNKDVRCLVVISGNFGKKGTEKFKTEFWNDAQVVSELKRFGLVTDPDMYFEAWIQLLPDSTAFRLVPTHFELNNNFYASAFSSERDLLISMSIEAPKDSGTAAPASGGESLGGTIFKLTGVKPGLRLEKSALDSMKTRWLPIPAGDKLSGVVVSQFRTANQALAERESALAELNDTDLTNKKDQVADLMTSDKPELLEAKKKLREIERDHLKKNLEKEKKALTNRIDSLKVELGNPTKNQLGPVNIEVAITETKNADQFLAALAAAFDKEKQNLAEKGIAALTPKTPAQIEAEVSQQENNMLAALQAESSVRQKQAELDKLDSSADIVVRTKAENELAEAKFKANVAYRKAGLPQPYTTIR